MVGAAYSFVKLVIEILRNTLHSNVYLSPSRGEVAISRLTGSKLRVSMRKVVLTP